jgi:hypothetical protein
MSSGTLNGARISSTLWCCCMCYINLKAHPEARPSASVEPHLFKVLGVAIPPTLLARRQGGRMKSLFAAVHESGCGTERRFRNVGSSVAFGGQADMPWAGKCRE